MLGALSAAAKVVVIPVPQSLQASRFKVTVNGKPAAFLNAAANYYELSLDLKGKAKGFVRIPTDGGYSFTLRSRDGGLLRIDDTTIARNSAPWPQVCGSVGNAVQAARGTIGLSAGLHPIRIEVTHTAGEDAFELLWEGPNIRLGKLPVSSLSHRAP